MLRGARNMLKPASIMRAQTRFFSHVTRNPVFSMLKETDLKFFESEIGSENVVTDPSALKPHNRDYLRRWEGRSKLMLKPNSPKQISNILRYCNKNKLAVLTQAGNTSLVGGATPQFDELILSTSRLNKMTAFDDQMGILTCEAGCVLENVNQWLEPKGHLFPLDLGAKGSCMIGGNIATNAGGTRFFRYGSLRQNVLGLQVVLADGRIIDQLSTLRKNTTGYDIKQFFIGSEGTLGVITAASVLCIKKPKSTQVALLGLNSFDDVLKTCSTARNELLEILSAVEFMDRYSLESVLNHIPGARDPMTTKYPFYMVIETQGSDSKHDMSKLNTFLEKAFESKVIQDGTIAQDETQGKALWTLREMIAEALNKQGTVYMYDISVPVPSFYSYVEIMKQRLKSIKDAEVCGFGHLADGNIHLTVLTPKYDQQAVDLMEPYLFERVAEQRGSVSSEHGLGQHKNEFIYYTQPRITVDVMKSLKTMMDPVGILNPYKLLPKN
eukprot:TRINITY_DN5992_c0_g1_i1.p1 TRINITY_DN5992_c0_g1~~TRINITY_DN5992_c0_g1_i1.p1  ORF type:complete len:517 (+),score=91.97 TRINITY_DN5992_c0_g1_i1:61-1551(+)